MNIVLVSEVCGGKDFIGEHLEKKYGLTRYAFADNVKNVAETWFPHMYGDGKEKPRSLLQAIGTKFREIDEDVWVKAMFEKIDDRKAIDKAYSFPIERIIITDCRLPNEYLALKNRGFIFIRIQVDEEIRLNRMVERGDVFKKEDMNHHTESYYDSFECDYIISNNGTPEEAYESIDEAIESVINSVA